MCFVQINGEKERGEIVWLYFGDVQFESSNRKKKKKTYFPAPEIYQTLFDALPKTRPHLLAYIYSTKVCRLY